MTTSTAPAGEAGRADRTAARNFERSNSPWTIPRNTAP
jgi:hypothetical protein